MFFNLTSFIYPIKKPIALSKYFNFFFDNPRTKKEISKVSALIQLSLHMFEVANPQTCEHSISDYKNWIQGY